MSLENIEIREIGIENLMPQRNVELEGTTYRVYLEEKVVDSDRCFGVSSINDPSDIKLFQITTDMDSNKNLSKLNLSELDIEDEQTAKYLLTNALDIRNRTIDELKNGNIQMKNLAKTIAIGNKNYVLSYQPLTGGIVNMREQYCNRVMRRIYGK